MGAFSLSENPFRMRFRVIALKTWTVRPSSLDEGKEHSHLSSGQHHGC